MKEKLFRIFDLYCAYDEKFDVPGPDYNDDFRLVLFVDGSGSIDTTRRYTKFVHTEQLSVVEWETLEDGIMLLEAILGGNATFLP